MWIEEEKKAREMETRKVSERQTRMGAQGPGADTKAGGRLGVFFLPSQLSEADPATRRWEILPYAVLQREPTSHMGSLRGLPRPGLGETHGSSLKNKRFACVSSLNSWLPPLHTDAPLQSTWHPEARVIF